MKSYIISLAEPVFLLKESFREQVAFSINNRSRTVPLMTGSLDYNAVPYMNALLGEILAAGQDPDMSIVPESTKMLVRDGLDQEVAFYVALQVFQTTVSSLGLMIPDMSFGNLEKYSVGMVSEFDAMVTPPWGHQLEAPDVHHEW